MLGRSLALCICGCLVGCCCPKGDKTDSSSSGTSEDTAAGDISSADIATMKSKLDCSVRAESYFCKALDRFAAGKAPATPTGTFFYPGLAIMVKTTKAKEVTEEASYYIEQPAAAAFDSIIPETEQEKKHRQTYLGYYYDGKLPPASDPLVKFCQTLSTSVVTPSQVAGKSLRFSRPLKTGQTNTMYARESATDIVVVEVAPDPLGLKLFFVGSFPKALKSVPKT